MSAPASAQQPDPRCEAPPSDRQARTLAGERFGRGMDAVATGDHPTALYEFLCSFQIRPHAYTAYNIARAADQVRHVNLAVEYYRIYLHLAGETDERAEVEVRLAELERDLAGRPGSLRIDAEPDGAVLVLDGETLGVSPLGRSVTLPPGRHHLQISAEGHRDHDAYVEVAGPEETAVAVTLVPLGSWRDAEAETATLWGPVLLGAAAVAAVAGVWLGLQASEQASEFRNMRDDGASRVRLEGQRDSARTTALVADISYLVALVAGGAGLWLFLSADGSAQQADR